MNQHWDSADPDEGIYVNPASCADIARAENEYEFKENKNEQ